MKNKSTDLLLENQLCFPLYAASRLTTKIYTPYLEKMGITYPQYLVMLVLWQHNSLSVKNIGEKLYLESNTLTPLLKRLEQKGLLSRKRSQEDERTLIVSLTTRGEKLKEQAQSVPEKIIESFNDQSIKEDELANFQNTLFKLLEILKERTSE